LNPLELTLGIMTAVGGFVDISELVFAAKAGSMFGYALIWVFALATIGIIYSYRQQVAPHRFLLYGLGGLFLMGLALRAIVISPVPVP
jgi:hypothetical protein